ncbi:MAG: hypothetical protein GC201_14760 [Alphaproteobacteria bacterium]|nr:hypothetical protein [Alphaproteobacteria bacterium]
MPNCSRGAITKTLSGTIKVTFGGVELLNHRITNQQINDSWNNCKCQSPLVFHETKCITATVNEGPDPLKDTIDLGHGVSVAYDLTVNSAREVTNCEYECRSSEPIFHEEQELLAGRRKPAADGPKAS